MPVKLTEKDINTLSKLCALKQEELKRFLSQKFLKKFYYEKNIVETEDYIYCKGNIPIALVAHLDTVFSQRATDVYYDAEKRTMWSPQGLGADDRAGVYAIIKILNQGLKPHVIFTTDEEIGGRGAYAISGIENPFEDLRYVIQLDRRGSDDCVFYDCANSSFVDYIESFGYKKAIGSFSDICFICPTWEIAGVNLSVGYRNEHSQIETLNTGDLEVTINRVIDMLQQENIPFFNYIYKKYPSLKGIGIDDNGIICDLCGEYHSFSDLEIIKECDGQSYLCCQKCLDKEIASDRVRTCEICGDFYEVSVYNNNTNICDDCLYENFMY